PDKSFRNQEGIDLILREVKILQHFRKYVLVSIPDPKYISIDPDCPFMGYEKIEGVPLHRLFNKIPREKKLQIANDIGKFLTHLHSKKLCKDAITHNLGDHNFTCHKYKKNLEQYFNTIRTTIFSLLNESQKHWIDNLFTSFLGNKANFKFNFSIIHGDFDTSNILVDPHSFLIRGIVDFEESRIYDRAADFLFYDEGKFFLKQILAGYKESIDDHFEDRMRFLYGVSCLGYFLFGIKHNLPDLINRGFQLLKKRMDLFPKYF
ncbi:MAG: phosphotransferase, partial [Candidatus Lokiarchaeota archaeon]